MSYHIIPLFSKVFYMKHIDVDTKKIVSMISDSFKNSGTNTPIDVDNITSASNSKFVLEEDKFSDLKKQIAKLCERITKEETKNDIYHEK